MRRNQTVGVGDMNKQLRLWPCRLFEFTDRLGLLCLLFLNQVGFFLLPGPASSDLSVKMPQVVWISHDGLDKEECLDENTDIHCRSLSFVLAQSGGLVATVFIKGSQVPYNECHWSGIDASVRIGGKGIRIEGCADEYGYFPTFKCLDPSKRHFISIWTPFYSKIIDIDISNISFLDTMVPLIGPQLNVKFSNVNFTNSLVISSSPICDVLDVTFSKVDFITTSFAVLNVSFKPVQNTLGHAVIAGTVHSAGAHLYCKKSSISLNDTNLVFSFFAAKSYLFMHVVMTNVWNTGSSGQVSNVLLSLGDHTKVSESLPNDVVITNFQSVQTWSNDSNFSEFAVIKIVSTFSSSDRILVEDSSFEEGSRGLFFSLRKLHDIAITRSSFNKNLAMGTGGAIWCQFEEMDGVLQITDSTFMSNRATISLSNKDSFSAGGAVYVASKAYRCSEIEAPNVRLANCSFVNNTAQAFGGNIFVGIGVFLDVANTTMIYSSDNHSWNGDLIAAECRLAFTNVNLISETTNGETSGIEFVPAFDKAFIRPNSLYIECPIGHFLDLRYLLLTNQQETGGAFASLQSYCKSCSENEYTPEFGHLYINYSDSESFKIKKNFFGNNVSCLPCPYGGDCNVGFITARPKFWGYSYMGEYFFQRCPDGYCCDGQSVSCSRYDSCAPARTGTLCGKCIEGYSESVLSTNCMRNEECDDVWVYPLCIVGALTYILCYAYKSDAARVCVSAFKFIVSKCERRARKDAPDTTEPKSDGPNTLPDSTFSLSPDTFQISPNLSPLPTPDSSVRIRTPSPTSLNNTDGNKHSFASTLQKRRPQKSEIQWTSLLTKLSHLDAKEKQKLMDSEDSEGVDRGYLGIITYFAQASGLMRVAVEFSQLNTSGILDTIEEYTVKYLDFDVYEVDLQVCPFPGINALFKSLIRTLFVISIYFLWLFMFVLTHIVFRLSRQGSKVRALSNTFRLKLIEGLVEVIKYTYSSLAGSNFSLLTCIYIGNTHVWRLDGTVTCFQQWQGFAAIVLFFYTIPFSFSLALGSKLIKEGKISSIHFLLSCILPLPFCLLWFLLYCFKWKKEDPAANHDVQLTDSAQVILDVLQAPYRHNDETVIHIPTLFFKGKRKIKPGKDEKGMNDKSTMSELNSAVYWEGVMEFRRLVLNALTLVDNDIIRLTLISVTCLVILLHHMYVKPFKLARSNKAETLSLSFLLIISVMNAMKAVFTENGVIPEGPNETLLLFFQRADNIFLFVLISFIVGIELYYFFKARYHKKECVTNTLYSAQLGKVDEKSM